MYTAWTDIQDSIFNTILSNERHSENSHSELSSLIYRTKRQASTGIGQHPLGTKLCYQYKCEQHALAFLQGTPASHLQNRPQESQVKDTEYNLLLTTSI